MNEINKILDDESNNDKELIRELSVYVKNHRDKGLPINGKFAKDIANIVLRNSEVDFEEIILNDDNRRMAAWWNEYGILEYNLTKILNYSKHVKKNWLNSKTGDNKVFAYYEVIASIIHEITHARQDYVTSNNKNTIYNPGNIFVKKHHNVYEEHHDEDLNERYANLREHVITYQVLSYIYPLKYINELRYDFLYYLLYGYKIDNGDEVISAPYETFTYDDTKIISAVDNYNSILESVSVEKVNIEANENMTLYDRLYLGLPITLEEYENIRHLSNKMRAKNDDVKKLINKL